MDWKLKLMIQNSRCRGIGTQTKKQEQKWCLNQVIIYPLLFCAKFSSSAAFLYPWSYSLSPFSSSSSSSSFTFTSSFSKNPNKPPNQASNSTLQWVLYQTSSLIATVFLIGPLKSSQNRPPTPPSSAALAVCMESSQLTRIMLNTCSKQALRTTRKGKDLLGFLRIFWGKGFSIRMVSYGKFREKPRVMSSTRNHSGILSWKMLNLSCKLV